MIKQGIILLLAVLCVLFVVGPQGVCQVPGETPSQACVPWIKVSWVPGGPGYVSYSWNWGGNCGPEWVEYYVQVSNGTDDITIDIGTLQPYQKKENLGFWVPEPPSSGAWTHAVGYGIIECMLDGNWCGHFCVQVFSKDGWFTYVPPYDPISEVLRNV